MSAVLSLKTQQQKNPKRSKQKWKMENRHEYLTEEDIQMAKKNHKKKTPQKMFNIISRKE